jgi:transmembrane sensor
MGQEHKEYTWSLIAKRLSGEATPEELQELERLLRSNPDLHYPMQTITDLWNPASPRDRKEAERAFNRHLDRMKELNIDFQPRSQQQSNSNPLQNVYPFPRKGSKNTHRRLLLRSALALAILTGILFGANYFLFSHASSSGRSFGALARAKSEISTHNGSKTNLVLPDGTRIWLNAGSKLTYDKNYGAAIREVNLSGEAFFDVVHNADKPFLIHTTRIDIKVLGTSFDVKSYSSDKTTEATLIRGSLEVSIKDRPSEKIILKPNEKLVVANDDSTLHRSITIRHKEDVGDEPLVVIRKPTYEQATGAIIETSWVDNKLIFREEKFGELAKQMERWYGITIRFTDPGQEEWRFTGTFQSETIKQALDALRMTANFNYTVQDNQITVYGK